MCTENFTLEKEILKEMEELQRQKEELLFLSLCSESDYNLLKKETPITLGDFERIIYLARHLGLANYCIAFENLHPELLERLGSQIEFEVLNNSVDIEDELLQRKLWEDEFLRGIRDSRMRLCIKKLFQL